MSARVRPGFRRVAIALFAILLPLAAHALWDYLEVRRLIREVAAIRDRGEPLTERDLGITIPRSAEQKQSSRLYLAAAALALNGNESDTKLAADLRASNPSLNQSPAVRDELVRRLEAVLSQYTVAFELLDKANQLDFSSLAPGTEHSYRTASFWSLTRLSSLRSQYYCLAGRADEAAEVMIGTLRLQRVSAFREPWLWMQADAIGVNFLFSHCAPSAVVLTRLQDAIDVADAHEVLVKDLTAERVFFVKAMWRYYGADVRKPEVFNFRLWTPGEALARPWTTHALVTALRGRAEIIDAARRPWRERQQILSGVARRSAGSFDQGPSPMGGVRSAALLDVDVPLADQRVAFMNAAHVAVAVERYRRDNRQSLPPTLADLVPAYLANVPVDPYSERPLLFKVAATNYTIYSVGRNGADDGGDVIQTPPRGSSRGVIRNSPDIGIVVQTIH